MQLVPQVPKIDTLAWVCCVQLVCHFGVPRERQHAPKMGSTEPSSSRTSNFSAAGSWPITTPDSP